MLGSIGIMEKKMETTVGIGVNKDYRVYIGLYRDNGNHQYVTSILVKDVRLKESFMLAASQH